MLCWAWQGRGAKCDTAPLSAHPKPGCFKEAPCPLPQSALPFFHLKKKKRQKKKGKKHNPKQPISRLS